MDAAHLVLSDVDLTDCLFAGTIHLDQLRLEVRCLLATHASRAAVVQDAAGAPDASRRAALACRSL